MWDLWCIKMAMGQVHLRILRLSPVIIIPPMPHFHLSPTLHNFSNSQRRYTTNNYTRTMDIAHWIYSAVTSVVLQHKNRIYLALQKTDRLKQKWTQIPIHREFVYCCRSTFVLSLCNQQNCQQIPTTSGSDLMSPLQENAFDEHSAGRIC